MALTQLTDIVQSPDSEPRVNAERRTAERLRSRIRVDRACGIIIEDQAQRATTFSVG
jgi:hypothetical protein